MKAEDATETKEGENINQSHKQQPQPLPNQPQHLQNQPRYLQNHHQLPPNQHQQLPSQPQHHSNKPQHLSNQPKHLQNQPQHPHRKPQPLPNHKEQNIDSEYVVMDGVGGRMEEEEATGASAEIVGGKMVKGGTDGAAETVGRRMLGMAAAETVGGRRVEGGAIGATEIANLGVFNATPIYSTYSG